MFAGIEQASHLLAMRPSEQADEYVEQVLEVYEPSLSIRILAMQVEAEADAKPDIARLANRPAEHTHVELRFPASAAVEDVPVRSPAPDVLNSSHRAFGEELVTTLPWMPARPNASDTLAAARSVEQMNQAVYPRQKSLNRSMPVYACAKGVEGLARKCRDNGHVRPGAQGHQPERGPACRRIIQEGTVRRPRASG